MRQKKGEVLEFRTPQHPSLGTNYWGGASPLLARNIPKESLEQKYTKLNTVRTQDEIFPGHDHDDYHAAKRWNKGRRGNLFKLLFVRKERNTITLGSHLKKRRWILPRMDPKTRWPNGWC
ncbi:hypothetical protein Fmac_030003 [Flemingia macrophylla]|uniref:Uncharacterized protein n=1 Tax=Flemingia macrophylla TaxID=520843 RepID=A0ABD1LBY9_9FABA